MKYQEMRKMNLHLNEKRELWRREENIERLASCNPSNHI